MEILPIFFSSLTPQPKKHIFCKPSSPGRAGNLFGEVKIVRQPFSRINPSNVQPRLSVRERRKEVPPEDYEGDDDPGGCPDR